MNAADILKMIEDAPLGSWVAEARAEFLTGLLEELGEHGGQLVLTTADEDRPSDLLSLATALERLALTSDGDEVARRQLFGSAYACHRGSAEHRAPSALHVLARLASDAVLSERPTELSMLLRELPGEAAAIPSDLDWPGQLELRSLRAFVLLCRRAGGWADIDEASGEIGRLRSLQERVERQFVFDSGDPEQALVGIVARYNIARIVDIAGTYISRGTPADALVQLDRHLANAERLLEANGELDLLHTTELVAAASRVLVRSSVWFSTRTLGTRVREFVQNLAAAGAEAPLLELWPSQREALGRGLLDPARRAIVAEMPTSAGKTLLAEFSIVQALALNPGSSVAYLVPTRALVNQLARRLRHDLNPLGYVVEAAVPVYELDPNESRMLEQAVNVLVTTPEKLDLLIRSEHPVVRDLSMVVADEAHNLGLDERGARLELLLATVKRERPQARFLLLTPFLPNASQLASWLADDPDASIRVDWRPSERIAAGASLVRPRSEPRRLQLRTLASAHRVDLDEEVVLDLGPVAEPEHGGKRAVTVALSQKLARRGGVLVLLNGRARAEDRAAEIAQRSDMVPGSALLSAVTNLAAVELGQGTALTTALPKGVAYHHAGLSHDLRYLIEVLVDRGEVSTVCGTTTLAQGVNFPIASVVVESFQKSVTIAGRQQWRELSFEEFWNIAGRAGRALRDRVGLVAFPVSNANELDEVREFLRRDASNVVSALATSLRTVGLAARDLNLRLISENPTLGVLFQYLTHAVRVAGNQAHADVEDLLRSSLIFHQVRDMDRGVAESLVNIARQFVQEARSKGAGYLTMADRTGFSLATVDYLFAVSRDDHPDFRRADFWRPDHLFGADLGGLTDVVSVLGRVPELSLGRTTQGTFDPQAVAGIVRDWVRGGSVSSIADTWFAYERDPVKRRRNAATYLFSTLLGQIPWGMGALQQLTAGDAAPDEAKHVPFMVFYGVDTEDATQLRMAGVPRSLAPGLVPRWRRNGPEGDTFGAVRTWLDELPTNEWGVGLADGASLTPDQGKLLWRELAGLPAVG